MMPVNMPCIDNADAVLISATMGGGTLDELTELYVQAQYGKRKPIVIHPLVVCP